MVSTEPTTQDDTRYVTPFTCAEDGLEHLVTDEAWARDRATGTVTALDGHVVVIGSSDTVGVPCPVCLRLHADCGTVDAASRLEVPAMRTPFWARLRRGAHAE